MKKGTFFCKIFGHKFIYWKQRLENRFSEKEPIKVNFCVRCGEIEKSYFNKSK